MPGPKLDHIDVRILEELQRNARITNQELAEKVALSPSACLARVRKLEIEGVLPRFLSVIALEKVERILKAFIEVTLESHNRSDMEPFFKAVEDHPNLIACQRVCGHFDFLLHVVVRDMPQLREIADYLLAGDLGVSKISTLPVMEEVKTFEGYPLKALLSCPDKVMQAHRVAI